MAPANLSQPDLEELILTEATKAGSTAWSVAEFLVDQDVSAGLYEGCSSELEMHFVEYERLAAHVAAEADQPECPHPSTFGEPETCSMCGEEVK
jgi:hypothetical protein